MRLSVVSGGSAAAWRGATSGFPACGYSRQDLVEPGLDVICLGRAELGVQSEGLLPVVPGLSRVGPGRGGAGEAVVGAGLQMHVAGLAGQGERGGVMGASLPVIAGGQRDFTEKVERIGLGGTRAGLAGQGQCQVKLAGRILVAALPEIEFAESQERVGLAVLVADVTRQDQGLLEIAGRLLMLITRRYALDDVNQAYADMRSGVNIRGVVDFIPAG